MGTDTNWLIALVLTTVIASIGWIISKLFEVALNLRTKVYLVQENLIYFARQISSPGSMKPELIKVADIELRRLASSIRSAADTVLLYRLWCLLRIIPPKDNVMEIALCLSLRTE